VEVAVESTGRACGGEVACVCDFNLYSVYFCM
jgi:hypothetical protein